MPLYVFRCPAHGLKERFLPLGLRNMLQECGELVAAQPLQLSGTTSQQRLEASYKRVLCRISMARVPTASSVRFKGSGFYQTDYKDKEPQRGHICHRRT